MSTLKVLLCSANPEVKNLQLAAEQRDIEERVAYAERISQKHSPSQRTSQRPPSFQFVVSGATRSRDLLRLLQLHTPQVLHISGHGAKGGELLLDSAESPFSVRETRTVVPKQLLYNVLREFSASLRLLFLNVCYSFTEAEQLTEIVDCVIAMNGTIEDPVALTFAATFYEQCALGSSVARAFRLAQAEVSFASGNPAMSQIPQLLVRRGIEPEVYHLVNIPKQLDGERAPSAVAELRRLIGQMLPFDASLQSFLLAYYPQVARQCGNDMQRTVKLNLLLMQERDIERLRERIEAYCVECAEEL